MQHSFPHKTLSILGVTGTIGQNCLDVLDANPGAFTVAAVTAQNNVEKLAASARRCGAKLAVIGNPKQYDSLKQALSGTGIRCASGSDGLMEAATMSCDMVLAAIVGIAGLTPTLAAVRQGRQIALANKECLVAAGDFFMETAQHANACIIPVDSEHNAIFQLLHGQQKKQIREVTLTASGGPFREYSLEQMRIVSPKQAVAHPNWKMGQKISVDSATMMNKALELIEAKVLFGFRPDQLQVIIHPQSIIHAMLSFSDGSTLAQLGNPDMRTPIAVALAWPERINSPTRSLRLDQLGGLHFSAPDENRFPSLRLAREAIHAGGAAPTVLNAANEVAVEAFLQGRIGFLDIAAVVEETLQRIPGAPLTSLEEILTLDQEVRSIAHGLIQYGNAA